MKNVKMKMVKSVMKISDPVENQQKFEEENHDKMVEIIDYCDELALCAMFGTNDDGEYLFQVEILADTVSECKGILSSVKKKVKKIFKGSKEIFQATGEKITAPF